MRAARNGVSLQNYRLYVLKPKQCHISSTIVHSPSSTADYCVYMKQMRRPSTGWQHDGSYSIRQQHWPHHQWVASPAGMCRPATRTHWTLFLNESVQFCVLRCLTLFIYLFVCWNIVNTFYCAVFWSTRYFLLTLSRNHCVTLTAVIPAAE